MGEAVPELFKGIVPEEQGLHQWFLKCSPKTSKSVSHGNLLEMQIAGPHSRNSWGAGALGMQPRNLCSNTLSRRF